MERTVSLETIGDLDNGAARLIINAAIREAVRDLDDRGEDGKPRTVNIVLSLQKPDAGKSNLVVAHVDAHAKMPPRRTGSTIARVAVSDQQPKLFFQDMAPEDPNQRTIDEVAGD